MSRWMHIESLLLPVEAILHKQFRHESLIFVNIQSFEICHRSLISNSFMHCWMPVYAKTDGFSASQFLSDHQVMHTKLERKLRRDFCSFLGCLFTNALKQWNSRWKLKTARCAVSFTGSQALNLCSHMRGQSRFVKYMYVKECTKSKIFAILYWSFNFQNKRSTRWQPVFISWWQHAWDIALLELTM